MLSKAYFAAIAYIQETLLYIGVAILSVLPVLLSYFEEIITDKTISTLYEISLGAVFFVMLIRPLADIFPNVSWLRPLVILRKGFGVLSASIIVSFMASKVLVGGMEYIETFFSPSYWNPFDGAILAPLGDISALILLVTSNRFSKRVLKQNWKRIQKLAYVYFYAGALYEYLLLSKNVALVYIIVVASVTVAAFFYKRMVPRAHSVPA